MADKSFTPIDILVTPPAAPSERHDAGGVSSEKTESNKGKDNELSGMDGAGAPLEKTTSRFRRQRPRSNSQIKAEQRGLCLPALYPRDMVPSGHEGYRTPTIEDYEREFAAQQAEADSRTAAVIAAAGGVRSSSMTAKSDLHGGGRPSASDDHVTLTNKETDATGSDESIHKPCNGTAGATGADHKAAYMHQRHHGCKEEEHHHHSGHHATADDSGQHVVFATRHPNLSKLHLHWHGVPHTPSLFSPGAGERFLQRLHWRERIRHYTWTFFAITMATGGIANVLHSVPFYFHGLYAIGCTFFLLNVVLFLFNVVMISLRFYIHPDTLRASFLHPTERLFVPAAVVSFGTILLNISQYGPNHGAGQWLNDAVAVLFWIDVGLAFLASMGIYLVMWSTESFTISQMTPVWIFPAYPLLIIGPHAGVLSQTVSQPKAWDIIIGGVTIQGIGFLVSLMIYSAFLYRLMTQKLPHDFLRPAMFVSVGPSAFTVAAILGMAEGAQRALPSTLVYFSSDTELAATVLRIIAAFTALPLWGLAMWFFFISVGAHWSCVLLPNHHFEFSMTWFSYVFPNTALITATFAVGKAFESKAIQIVGCVMTPILILAWLLVCVMMIRAVIKKHILWPQRGEDKDEGGFLAPRGSGKPGRVKRSNTAAEEAG